MVEISTKQLLAKMGKQGVRIIDTRPVDAYNGWTIMNESRGGHIAGAKSLPYRWTQYMDWIEMLGHKEIGAGEEVIVYGYAKNEIDEVSGQFKRAGYNHIKVYYHFLSEWCRDTSLPMEKLERYQHLVPAQWVNQLITQGDAPGFKNDNFIIVHAHYRNRDAYLSGHIPGAIDMDTLAVEAPESWNRRPPEELKRAFEEHGISRDTTVILYGKYMHPDNNDPFPGSAAGDIGAIRIAFIMMYAGIKDVRVLNGGFHSWEAEGFEVSHADEQRKPVVDFGPGLPVNPEFAVDTPEAKNILAADDAALVCVRSWQEYIGEVSGYNYILPKGRIPGAIFADCGSDAYHMENYRNFDHTTREYHEIEAIWLKNGITPDKHLAFYCGTGWRGSEAWFNAWLMGWPRISVYDGGWFEWSSDPENPYETGTPVSARKKISQYL
jgi:thiosulfate/3-mercaptopyruvate sulfurtransferase